MTLGQKIKKLRTEKGLTQKDLADHVHVTFQTVSKWENDENEPDVSTLRELAKLFNCSLDYLLSEDDAEEPEREEEPVVAVPVVEEPAPAPAPTTVIIHEHALHVCAKCGRDIPESELVSEDVHKKERVGRTTRTVSVGQTYYHRACLDEIKRIREEKAREAKATKTSRSKKMSFGWGIAGGVIAFGIALCIFLFVPECKAIIHPALAVLYSILIGYGIFAMIYCILSGSYIGDVFLWCSKLSIRFPGIIFSWDLGGFAFLIAMKILFAVIGFLIGVFAFLFAVALSATLGGISFPFVLIHNIHTEYEDSLV